MIKNAIDIVQLHGIEDDNYIEELKAITDKKIIKAFMVNESFDIKKV